MSASLIDTQVIAIDGGGSRCRFALARIIQHGHQHIESPTGKRIVCEGGPANVTTAFDAAVDCIHKGLLSLAELSGTDTESLYAIPAFVGLAGATGSDITTRLRTALPLQSAIYTDDRAAALRGALGDSDGLVAHCGTGSFLAAQIDGTRCYAGGWGSTLGDEASAQWVGRKSLSLTLQQTDGFLSATPLINALSRRFENTDAIIQFAARATPDEFGVLAPLVTEHARQGDPLANGLLQSAADYLSDSIDKMGWRRGLRICLTGGIGPHYQQYLPKEKRDAVVPACGDPLDGAVELALTQREKTHEYR